MKTKDQQLLEEAYLKTLLEDEKFQPNDPEMQELSKVGMVEEFPEDQDPRNLEDDNILSPEENRAQYEEIMNAVNSIIDSDEKFKNIGNTIDNFIEKNLSEMVSKFKQEHSGLVEGDVTDDIKSYFDKKIERILKNQSKFLANL
ncbi:MAG: hypothetical protein RL728_468 [Bacteroidota bacterium]|jgi:hypothetical protein